MVDVFVTRRWRVRSQGLLVSRDRRRHAQSRVGIDVVGADQALGQLVEYVVILGQKLTGDIESGAVGAVRAHGVRETIGKMIERFVPAMPRARGCAAGTKLGIQRAAMSLRSEMQCRALGAQPAEVGRML